MEAGAPHYELPARLREDAEVDREDPVLLSPRPGAQAVHHLPLQHEDPAGEAIPQFDQPEDDGGGDGVREISDHRASFREAPPPLLLRHGEEVRLENLHARACEPAPKVRGQAAIDLDRHDGRSRIGER